MLPTRTSSDYAPVAGRYWARGVRFHQQASATARNVRDDSGAAMELGDGPEIDGEGELDLLPLAQSQVSRFDEDARGTQIHGTTKLPATAGDIDVDGGSGAVPRMQSTFHGSWSSLYFCQRGINGCDYAFVPACAQGLLNLSRSAPSRKSCDHRPVASSEHARSVTPLTRNLSHVEGNGHRTMVGQPCVPGIGRAEGHALERSGNA